MNDVREEAIGWVWVVLGGFLTFLLPAWLLLTAMVIQLSPELSGVDMVVEGLAVEPTSPPFFVVWIEGGLVAARGLVVVAPLLGAVVAVTALIRRGSAAHGERFHAALEAEVRSDAVLEGVELVAHTEASGDALPEEGGGSEVALASPVHRIGAWLLDVVLSLGAYLGPVAAVAPFVDLTVESPEPLLLAGGALSVVVLIVVVAVQLHGLATRGQTVGKRILGLRIVRPDGTPASAGSVVGVRTFAWGLLLQLPVIGWFLLPLADIVLLLADERHQTLHDRLADTVVVEVS